MSKKKKLKQQKWRALWKQMKSLPPGSVVVIDGISSFTNSNDTPNYESMLVVQDALERGIYVWVVVIGKDLIGNLHDVLEKGRAYARVLMDFVPEGKRVYVSFSPDTRIDEVTKYPPRYRVFAYGFLVEGGWQIAENDLLPVKFKMNDKGEVMLNLFSVLASTAAKLDIDKIQPSPPKLSTVPAWVSPDPTFAGIILKLSGVGKEAKKVVEDVVERILSTTVR